MNKDITHWARTCLPCQRAKIHRHVRRENPEKITIPDERFKHIHLDLIGPLLLTNNFKYCLTIVDQYTRWPEAAPLTDATAESVAKVFFSTWVSRFGAPQTITTDQGTQFESRLFKILTQIIGCKRTRTSPYHPASNSMLERWHRTLKSALSCHLQNNIDWTTALPTVLLGLRTVFKDDLGCFTSELLYGTTLRVPGEFFEDCEQPVEPEIFVQELRERIRRIRAKPSTHHNKITPFMHKNLQTTTHVFLRDDTVRRPLQPPYLGLETL